MTAQITELTPRRVTVDGGLVRITDLTSSDVDLLRILTSADDPEATVQRALAIGARALEVANASVDTAVVEASFENLRQRMSELVDAGQGQLTGTATELFDDPDTGVKAALARWSEQVQTLLEQTFDPARTDSAVGKLHLVLAESGDAQIAATRRMLNPDAEDSPLSRLAASMREQIATVLDALGRLAEQVSSEHAGAAATRAAMERSAVKGMAFEALVGRAVTDIAATRGDVAEPTGTTTGVTGGRVGDYVVEVADGGTYVLECKDRPRSLTAILAELDAAAANREAAAAIAIFSSTEHCPVTGPIAIFDDRVIVVYDKHDPDPAALTLACSWARASAIARSRTADGDGLDLAQIRAAVETARDALTRASVIRRAHTGAARKITEAGEQLDILTSNVAEALAQVDTAIAAAFDAGATAARALSG